MRKLKLALEELTVEAFVTDEAASDGGGTVRGQYNQPAQTNQQFPCGGGFTEDASCGYTACGDQGCSNMFTWCADCTDHTMA